MKKIDLNLLAGLLGLVAAIDFSLEGKTSFGVVWLAIGIVFMTLSQKPKNRR